MGARAGQGRFYCFMNGGYRKQEGKGNFCFGDSEIRGLHCCKRLIKKNLLISLEEIYRIADK